MAEITEITRDDCTDRHQKKKRKKLKKLNHKATVQLWQAKTFPIAKIETNCSPCNHQMPTDESEHREEFRDKSLERKSLRSHATSIANHKNTNETTFSSY